MQMRWLFLAVTIFMLGGCGGVDWFPVADPNAAATVTVSSNPPAAGVITITADVSKTDGTPVADGTLVSFSTNGGTLSASSATTAGGIASTTLTSVDPGSFTVTASSGNASGNTQVAFLAVVTTVTALPSPATPGAPVTVTATVKKPDGVTNVNDGTPVNFTAIPATGTFTPATQNTTAGVAAVTFSGPAATYTIRAAVGAAFKEVTLIVQ